MSVTCKLDEKGCYDNNKCLYEGHCENKVVTIGDKLRSWNDLELATFLLTEADLCKFCNPTSFCIGYPCVSDERCINAVVQYLQQPYEKGEST